VFKDCCEHVEYACIFIFEDTAAPGTSAGQLQTAVWERWQQVQKLAVVAFPRRNAHALATDAIAVELAVAACHALE
jgi:hypothetical protein